MDSDTKENKAWSSTQAYGLAGVCLLVGILCGYLFHAPAAVPPQNTAVQQTNGQGMGAQNIDPQNITMEQLQSMVEKTAAPLIAKLQQNPNDAQLLTQIASVYMKGHAFDKASEYLERAAKASPSADTLVQLGIAYHYAGSDDKAIDSFNRALAVDSKSANALFNLGMLEWQAKGDTKAAIAAWQKLLQTNPNHPKRAQVQELIARAKKNPAAAPGLKTDKPAM